MLAAPAAPCAGEFGRQLHGVPPATVLLPVPGGTRPVWCWGGAWGAGPCWDGCLGWRDGCVCSHTVKRAPLGAEALRTPGWSLTPTLAEGWGWGDLARSPGVSITAELFLLSNHARPSCRWVAPHQSSPAAPKSHRESRAEPSSSHCPAPRAAIPQGLSMAPVPCRDAASRVASRRPGSG